MKKTEAKNKLIELLQKETELLSCEFKKASIEGRGTPQEVSDRREGIIQNFFRKYYPFPFQITKGNIIDCFGQSSNSIDCIILNPSHPHTINNLNNKHSVIFADGTDFAIELKTDLRNKKEFSAALEQVASVKRLKRRETRLIKKDGKIIKEVKDVENPIPCIVFATKVCDNTEAFLKRIAEFYKNKNYNRKYQVDIIAINDKKIILNKGTFVLQNYDKSLVCINTKKDTLAYLLFLMSLYPLSQMKTHTDVLKPYLEQLDDKDYIWEYCQEAEEILSEII